MSEPEHIDPKQLRPRPIRNESLPPCAMKDEPTKSPRSWKLPLMIVGVLLLGVSDYVYVALPWYPLYRANRTPGRAWSAWDAADHNVVDSSRNGTLWKSKAASKCRAAIAEL